MVRAGRQQRGVFGRGRLQLEVELPAEALPQRERPSFVDGAADRRVQHELHAARFVEEALEDEGVLRRNHAERGAPLEQIARGLFRAAWAKTRFLLEPTDDTAIRRALKEIGRASCRERV